MTRIRIQFASSDELLGFAEQVNPNTWRAVTGHGRSIGMYGSPLEVTRALREWAWLGQVGS